MKFNYSINGKIYSFGLVCKGHAERREIERARKCSFDQIGQTIRSGLAAVVTNSTTGKDLILVNEDKGHTVVLNLQKVKETFIMTVKTVIDEGKNLWISKKHRDSSIIVRV